MAKMNKKSLTKHDLLRAIKQLAMHLEFLQQQVGTIDKVVDALIRMNKDSNKLEKFIAKEIKERKNEHKQKKT